MPRKRRTVAAELVRRARAGGPTPLNPDGPDHEVLPPLPLVERPVPPALRAQFPAGTEIRSWALGHCSVIVTRHEGRSHLSIAHPARDPTWNEIAAARYRVLPEVAWMAMYLPPRDDYVNLHRHCFQLVECEPLPRHI